MDQANGLREQVAQKLKPESATASATPLRVIAITSGKGGVGKTNISANLAVLAAKQGQRVLVLDADLGLANVEILYGIKPQYHLGHLLDDRGLTMDEVLAQGPEGVRVLSAGSGIRALTRLDDTQKQRLLNAMEEIENSFDVVLIDTGAGIGDNVLFFAGAAQEALLVVSPEPTSLTDAYAAVKVLSLEGKVEHFSVVVNQAAHDAQARDLYKKLCTVTSRFLTAQMRYAGFIPRDENLRRAVMAQRPLVDVFPQSPASRALSSLRHFLLSGPPPKVANGGLKFLWYRMLRDSALAGG